MLNILLILPRAEYIGLYIAGAFFDPIVGLIVGAGHLYKSKQYIPLDILIYNWPASPVHPWAGCGKHLNTDILAVLVGLFIGLKSLLFTLIH